MSLGIAFKGPEGIVLAADSRVTLTAARQTGNEIQLIPATFDNATKLLKVNGQNFVGAVTYGSGAIGEHQPRTAHSFVPEFEQTLKDEGIDHRIKVEDFAEKLSNFYLNQWNKLMPKDYQGNDMVFLVGGYNEKEPYGRVFKIAIPSEPEPIEQNANSGDFGMSWGGQLEYTTRLIKGLDPSFWEFANNELKLSTEQLAKLDEYQKQINLPIPFPFLPLQDCVDLSMFFIRTTMEIQNWMVGIRGVGGEIDVATITRTNGFEAVQLKTIRGQKW